MLEPVKGESSCDMCAQKMAEGGLELNDKQVMQAIYGLLRKKNLFIAGLLARIDQLQKQLDGVTE